MASVAMYSGDNHRPKSAPFSLHTNFISFYEFGPRCTFSIQATKSLFEKFFFQFWESENTGLFSSVTAPILNKTYFSLNLRKDWPLIKSYLLHRSSQAWETLFLIIFGNLLGAIFNQRKEHVLIIDQISTCKFLL